MKGLEIGKGIGFYFGVGPHFSSEQGIYMYWWFLLLNFFILFFCFHCDGIVCMRDGTVAYLLEALEAKSRTRLHVYQVG